MEDKDLFYLHSQQYTTDDDDLAAQEPGHQQIWYINLIVPH